MKAFLYAVTALALSGAAAPAMAATTFKLDVVVRSEAGVLFSAPIFTFTNLSTPGVQVSGVAVSDGPPWDWVLNVAAPYEIVNPTGGTRTLLIGEEATFDTNNGVTSSISYGLTSFDPGDFFRFSADPEASNGGSAVIDIRPFLIGDTLRITAGFAGGPKLSGTDWTLGYFNPNGDLTADSNQFYRLTLEQTVVPEPSTWAFMIVGFGLAGTGLRARRRRQAPALAPGVRPPSSRRPWTGSRR